MIRLKNIRFEIDCTKKDIEDKLCRVFGCYFKDIIGYSIASKSLDARKTIAWTYSFDVSITDEARAANHAKEYKYDIEYPFVKKEYAFPVSVSKPKKQPVVVGFGPAGIFCSLMLAENGYNPIIVERGECLEKRSQITETFKKTHLLNENTNIQFGEGGAGAFSDGKLTTLIKDKDARCAYILNRFVKAGAPEEILYLSHPHIGTDKLRGVIKNIRTEIENNGGEFHFATRLEDIIIEDGRVSGVKLSDGSEIETDTVLLCIGHSARDTFEKLYQLGLPMESKPFSVGVRIEHLQETINKARYHEHYKNPALPVAEYKAVAHTKNGRSLYTFCMCPGGYVTAATSERGCVVTNGMSYHSRDGKNANSALLVSIENRDLPGKSPLDGIEFQRNIERKAFLMGGSNYKAPAQTVGDFFDDKPTKSFGRVRPTYSLGVTGCNLRDLMPRFISETVYMGIKIMEKQLEGFSSRDAVLTGIESRSTCPVRILRNEDDMQTAIKGIYPVGEGAGYAGGIMSAACDGIKSAEAYVNSLKLKIKE